MGSVIFNPVTPAGLHLRKGMLVIWQDDDGSFRLVRLVRADSGAKRSKHPAAPQPLMADIDFLNGVILRTPIDRLIELPRHDPAYRRRVAFRAHPSRGKRPLWSPKATYTA